MGTLRRVGPFTIMQIQIVCIGIQMMERTSKIIMIIQHQQLLLQTLMMEIIQR